MRRIGVLALCAIFSASALLPGLAAAQEAVAPAVKSAPAGKPAAKARRRKPAAAHQAAAPAPVDTSYQLVPSKPGSALSRARQNSFGTPDEDPAPSGGSRRIGVGLGGANGMTPGMAIGF